MNPLPFVLTFLLVAGAGSSCLTSSENFATEVVIPSGNLINLPTNFQRSGDNFISRSQYDSNLISIVSQTTDPNGISVRLQMPTDLESVSQPRVRLSSSSAQGTTKTNMVGNYAEWSITCLSNQCTFKNNDLIINTPGPGKQGDVILEIDRTLPACSPSCSGSCFSLPSGQKCIDSKTKSSLDSIFRYSNTSVGIDQFLKSYRLIGTEQISVSDIVPSNETYINWQEAMRQELVFLKAHNVVNLERQEIEDIVSLAAKGQAGQNYRIVLDSRTNQWVYYDSTQNPKLTEQRDCTAYGLPQSNDGPSQAETIFYTVPLVILGTGIVTLLILIVIARTITKKKHR